MLTISVRNSRHVPMGPVTEVTLTLGTKRRPWCSLHIQRYPDRREPVAKTGETRERNR